MIASKINWIGKGKRYDSECGQFIILNTSMTTRSHWTLTDKSRRHVCLSQYDWSEHCTTLASAKRKAERILSCESKQPV